MDESEFYLRAVRRLLDRYAEIVGDAAYGIAEGCDMIEMEDRSIGAVEDGADALSEFVACYEEVIGQVATRVARETVMDMEKPEDVDVPERMRQDGA